jgi:hypothetical protein
MKSEIPQELLELAKSIRELWTRPWISREKRKFRGLRR